MNESTLDISNIQQMIFFLGCLIMAPYVIGKLYALKSKHIEVTNPNHYYSLDSLRFILAFSVMIHHSTCLYNLLSVHEWSPISGLFAMIGPDAVFIFFMITAFLFWGKYTKEDEPNWIAFFIKRFFRIVPLVVVNSILCLLILWIHQYLINRSIHISHTAFLWFDFLNNHKPNINDLDGWVPTAGVFWTLVYEWSFYFALPLLWIIYMKHKHHGFALALSFFYIYCIICIAICKCQFKRFT